jgi:hypothetical protein
VLSENFLLLAPDFDLLQRALCFYKESSDLCVTHVIGSHKGCAPVLGMPHQVDISTVLDEKSASV